MSDGIARGLGRKRLALAGLVRVQKGAVTSRQVMSRPGGNVTVFAFDEGEGLSEHTAPFDALVSILEGQALIRLGGEDFALKAGESILMPAHVPHALKATKAFKMLLTLLRATGESSPAPTS